MLFVTVIAVPDCKCDRPHPDTEKAIAIRGQVLDALSVRLAECTPTNQDAVRPLLQLEPIARFDIARALSEGRMMLAPDNMQACLGFIRTSSCESARRGLTAEGSPCAKLFLAQSKDGGACVSELDCTGGLFCNVDDLHCPGECQRKGSEGVVCDARTPCAPGLSCTCNDNNCREKTCRVPTTEGAFCGKSTQPPCADDHFCVPLGLSKAQTCQPRQKDGEACVSVDGCLFPLKCVGGSCRRPRMIGEACVPRTSECTDLSVCKLQGGAAQCLAWGNIGAACGPINEGKEYSGCVGGYCELDALGKGTCKVYKVHGEACSSANAIDFVCGPGRCDTLMKRCVYPCDVKPQDQ